jgi:hypothetical protein
MKTIEQHLREALTPEQFKKAKEYQRIYWEMKCTSPKLALEKAFVWRHTQECFDYWNDIHNNL